MRDAPTLRRPYTVSRAVARLRESEPSQCPHCGRETVTTSDGICADCWGSKGGQPMGWSKRAPRATNDWFGWVAWMLFDWWWWR